MGPGGLAQLGPRSPSSSLTRLLKPKPKPFIKRAYFPDHPYPAGLNIWLKPTKGFKLK